MARTSFLALAAFTLLTPLLTSATAQAETVTIVKTGEIVTTTYKMPSAPVAGNTEMMTSTIVKDYDESTSKEDVIRWRDGQPIAPELVAPSSGVNAEARKTFTTYNE